VAQLALDTLLPTVLYLLNFAADVPEMHEMLYPCKLRWTGFGQFSRVSSRIGFNVIGTVTSDL